MSAEVNALDPRFLAAVQLLERCGAAEFQVRYQDDEKPVVWIAVVRGRADIYGDENHWEVAAAITPLGAVMRLCEQVVDGGECAHCHKMTAFDESFGNAFLEPIMCWHEWDPELQTFRRGCE